MIALIQRVTRASVTVAHEVTGEIGPGLLVLLGVEKDDDEQKANRLCERVLGYRIFSDAEGGRVFRRARHRIAQKPFTSTLLSAVANRT